MTRSGARAAGRCDTDTWSVQAGVRGARADARGAQAGREACARLGVLLGCAFGALSLFLTRFDSVLFLSQFLDIGREPDS